VRRTLIPGLVGIVAALGLSGVMSAPAWASVPCSGVLSGPIHDTVLVAPNGFCDLTNATVDGNVVVGANGALRFTGSTTVYGSVVSSQTMSSFITDDPATVWGNVSINGITNTVFVCAMTIHGNLYITNSAPGTHLTFNAGCRTAQPIQVGGAGAVAGNHGLVDIGQIGGGGSPTVFGGNLTVANNVYAPRPGFLEDITVFGSLACGSNSPRFQTADNTVHGSNGGASGTC
jgi:hypothetical protein